MGKWKQRSKTTGKVTGIVAVAAGGLYLWNQPEQAAQDTEIVLKKGGEVVAQGGGVVVTYLTELGNATLGDLTYAENDGKLTINAHGNYPNCVSGVYANDETHDWLGGVLEVGLGITYEESLNIVRDSQDLAAAAATHGVIYIDC